jgi:hypothetical protein
MKQSIGNVAVVVKDYGEATRLYVDTLVKDLYGNLWDLLQLKKVP